MRVSGAPHAGLGVAGSQGTRLEQRTCLHHRPLFAFLQVMRLHAVLVVRQPPLAPTPQAASLDLASAPAVAQARAAALELLTLALGGDALAAEYLLLACLARVASRWVGAWTFNPEPCGVVDTEEVGEGSQGSGTLDRLRSLA